MSRAKGNRAEDRATLFLEECGYLIVERNFYSRFGEIDIIATKDATLHFIEVKSGVAYEVAIQNITRTKLSRIIKTADVYRKKSGFDGYYSIDAVVVTPHEVALVENITL